MKHTEQLIADELAHFIVSANQDLVSAELDENYEQCSLIQTAIDLKLHNEATLIAGFKTGYTQAQIFKIFKDNSVFVYKAIKNKYSKI